MTKRIDREITKIDHLNGGAGFVIIESLINETERGGHCGLFSKVTIKAGCELGYHEHHGETETYYITSGKGLYDDNGKTIEVEAGDVVFCKDDNGHGMKNNGYADLEFIALILKN